MANAKIECRKIRSFGENFNDTFEFIRQNAKPLLWAYLGIAGVFVLVQAVLQGYFAYGYMHMLRGVTGTGFTQGGLLSTARFLGIRILPLMIFTWLAYIAMQVCIGAYMKFYQENGRQAPSVDQVWDIFRRYFFRVLLGSIPVTLLTIAGTLFCVAPGIYLAVVLVPFPWILIMEDASIGEAFNRCFQLTKESFWESLLIYLVTYLVFLVAHLVFGFFAGVLSRLLSFATSRSLEITVGGATAVTRVFGFVFFIIFLVSSVLHYFNLVERREAPGMMERVQRIGEQTDTETDASETY